MEIVLESLRLANAPYTVFLVLILLYWTSVILGVLDIETLDFDFDMDADMDMDMDAEGATDGLSSFHFWSWLNIGAVPFSLWLSIFGMLGWFMSMVGNAVLDAFHLSFLNNVARFLGLGVFIIPFSAILTKFIAKPLQPVFKTRDSITNAEMVYEVCKITSSEVNQSFGLAEIMKDGAQILINVRARPEEGLTKGDKALILYYKKKGNFYEVSKFNYEELRPQKETNE